MMTPIVVIALTLSLFVVTISAAEDYRDYCKASATKVDQGADVFVPVAATYPHVHCAKAYIGYSTSANSRRYLANPDPYCNVVREVLDDIKSTGNKDMVGVIIKFAQIYCKKKDALNLASMDHSEVINDHGEFVVDDEGFDGDDNNEDL